MLEGKWNWHAGGNDAAGLIVRSFVKYRSARGWAVGVKGTLIGADGSLPNIVGSFP
jgi:hypothetical protein